MHVTIRHCGTGLTGNNTDMVQRDNNLVGTQT
jgi:hypothetical protein